MTGPRIHPRADWGFPGWAKGKDGKILTPYSVTDKQRTEFFTHYEGASRTKNTGAQAMRDINAGHRANGWSGVGYNFVVMQDGSIWEGRGWLRVGAHCPKHNTSGVGVQIHIGGDQEPSREALQSCRALYDEACRRAGRTLAKRGHRDGIATECPGTTLYSWVRSGMPAPTDPPPTEKENLMEIYVEPDGQQPGDGVYCVMGTGVTGVNRARWDVLTKLGGARAVTISRAQWQVLRDEASKPAPVVDIHQLAAEIVAQLPPVTVAGAPTAAEIATEVLARLRLVQGA